jgi:hypothetical protein
MNLGRGCLGIKVQRRVYIQFTKPTMPQRAVTHAPTAEHIVHISEPDGILLICSGPFWYYSDFRRGGGVRSEERFS